MKIVINNHRKIFAIQEEFSSMFPGLKIGFHAKPNNHGGAPSPKLVMHSSRTLQDCRVVTRKGSIEITPLMNISELKENFSNEYGLSVEIFPKTGNGGNETPVGENFTLDEVSKKYSA